MKKEKILNYSLELILIIILFFALFVSNIFTKIVISIILVVYMILTHSILKKRNILSIYHKQVTILMILIGIVYVAAFYIIGLYFGYYHSTVQLSFWSIKNYIIPISLIIISSEVIRNVLLVEKSKISKILLTIAMVLIDSIFYIDIYEISNLQGFLDIIFFTICAAISSNILYNYISFKYGSKPIIAFKLITVLYIYIIPITPNVQIVIRCFLRMLYPYLIYLLLEYTYEKNNFVKAYQENKKNAINISIMLIIMTAFVMLISCKFKYGMLVIGSESMTGVLNKGDAVIFEAYDNQEIKIGEIIIFEKDNTRVIHRVTDIQVVKGEYRYSTKGDANEQPDEGYITSDKIIGISKIRIYYIGYPSILLREAFV